MNEELKFYQKLYTECDSKTKTDSPNLTNFIHIPKLSQADSEICDELITLEEISNSLKDLPNNKTPGSDGLTTEFYKFFWPDLKKIVFDRIQYAVDNDILSVDQRRGILNIIPKKDKDVRLLKNWRPIALLNTDYKILTKLLAKRLQKVLFKIIASDQTGYIKNRYIGENIRTIIDIMQYTAKEQLPGILLQLDFKKAFDSVSWKFLNNTLYTLILGQCLKSGSR